MPMGYPLKKHSKSKHVSLPISLTSQHYRRFHSTLRLAVGLRGVAATIKT